MVNLVKARQKAKRGAGDGERKAEKPKEDKLEKFKRESGVATVARGSASETAATPQDSLELLTFAIGNEQYAIEVERVMEIATPRPLTRVPNSDAFIRGIMSLRGVVVTMVDVRGRLRHPPNGAGQQVIVVTDRGGPIGFDVDRVLRPLKIGREAIEPHPVVHPSEERPSIRGVFRHAKTLTILLDLEKLLGSA